MLIRNIDGDRAARRPGVRARSRRLGAAVVEFAILAPLLVLLIVGMVEVTRAVQVKMALSDSVRHACRIGIQPHTDNSMVEERVKDILKSNEIGTSDVEIDIKVNGIKADVKTAQRHDRVSLAVTLSLSEVGWVTPLIFAADAKQTETITMMRQ
jgi:Flp pilus assembly protein TadG